ncbi:AraC family transcriptional regulator N-terminal domain-containing protein [Promicromonospora sp. CA-289599]|uniref:AraC family transcriptional regulator N-terminal domain-containing protein n=1 Tax=Promicromonospora sp. CA-289599 TaxID=3240014 RepID=UPI003D8BF5FB
MDDVTSDRLDHALASALRNVGQATRASRIGLRVSQVPGPTKLGYQRYRPSLSVVLAGWKRSIVVDDDDTWGRERFIITPVDLPVVAGVVSTDPDVGFVAGVWQLDTRIITEVAATMSRPHRDDVPTARLGTWTPGLADASARSPG